ncbi:hypothetical protein THAOC_16445 [Thalassiosira oceanica]|uniref:Uncharacterized protein n=1 Tax=Thalassiosira oceanica TaxID=159749 RepID=K0SPH7_THAOC|nr:hypothetical protein THAOC_16445 [Thalassiosira oceanica]|eukprot:EJK62926.1 hypothetical protein THAOC_16445 [Thalassiosira oceanica]
MIDDRDEVEFWEQQKQEYLKKNPSHAGMFTGDDEEAELDVGLKNDEGNAMWRFDILISNLAGGQPTEDRGAAEVSLRSLIQITDIRPEGGVDGPRWTRGATET